MAVKGTLKNASVPDDPHFDRMVNTFGRANALKLWRQGYKTVNSARNYLMADMRQAGQRQGGFSPNPPQPKNPYVPLAGSAPATGTTTGTGGGETPAPKDQTRFTQIITSALTQIGLATPGLIAYLKGLNADGKISDNPYSEEIIPFLWDQADFRARFPSIAAQADKRKGDPSAKVWSPAEVVAYEDELRNALKGYGVSGYDVKEKTAKLILGDVSAQEAVTRVNLAAYAATTGPREVAEALMQHEGIGPGDIVSFYLNPDHAQGEIQRKHAVAQMQAWQMQQNLKADWQFSEKVVAQGISNDQAQQAFAQVAVQQNLTSGYGETTTEQDTKQAALGMSAQSEASVNRSLSSRQGGFKKSGGAV